MNNTVGMILAAGLGTRLKELTSIRPKPLMEIGGKAILYHQIRMLEKAGIKDIFINLHYFSDLMAQTISSWDLDATLHFSFEESILGTAGGVRQVINKFGLSKTNMILLHGDMICDIDFQHSFLDDELCSLVIAKNRTLSGYKGGVYIDENNSIVELGAYFSSPAIKKDGGFFTGIHFLSKQALSFIKACHHTCLVSEIYPLWLRQGLNIKGLVKPLFYDDLGTPERLLLNNLSLCAPHTHFKYYNFLAHFKKIPNRHILVGAHAQIDPSATIRGPVIIGKNALIDADTSIGPYAVIGDNVHVDKGASIKRSLVLSDTIIEKDEQLDCIIALSKARVLEGNIKNDSQWGKSC